MPSSRSAIISVLAIAFVLGLAAGLAKAQGVCTFSACSQGKLCKVQVGGGLGSYKGPTCGVCIKPWWFFPSSTCFCGQTGGIVGPKGPAVYCNPSQEYCYRKSGVDFSSYSCKPLQEDLQGTFPEEPVGTFPGPPDGSRPCDACR